MGLETVLAIAIIAVVATKLPGAIVDEIRAARGKEPVNRRKYRRDGFWGWLGDVWEDAWADARAARQRRRANRDPAAPRTPGMRSWLSTAWAHAWERAELRHQARRERHAAAASSSGERGRGELVDRLSGPCALCGEKTVTRVGRSWMHVNPRTMQPSCVPVWTRDGWAGADPSLTVPPGLQRPCTEPGCDGTQRVVTGTVIDAGDGHRQALAECDTCGSRWRRWWWERDPSSDNGWIEVAPTPDHDQDGGDQPADTDTQDASDEAGDQGTDTGPAEPGQEHAEPVSGLHAERDGVPLEVQLFKPVPAPNGGTEYQEVPNTMPEITGLATSISYAEGMSKSHETAMTDAELFQAGLSDNGVSGKAIDLATEVMELERQVSEKWGELAAEMAEQDKVREAYDATPGAGSREFVTSE